MTAVRGKSGVKPSDKLNPKTIDPFNSKQQAKSTFATEYNNGTIPCRLNHGSVKHSLDWRVELHTVPFDPVLIMLANGLTETKHPFTFLSEHGIRDLLQQDDASQKLDRHTLDRMMPYLKQAMMIESRFEAVINCLGYLSNVVREDLNPHLKAIMQQVAKKATDKKFRDQVIDFLHVLEENGGPEALKIIKSKVPTYTSVMM